MRKRIIIGLTIFSLIFLLGSIYIIITIESSTTKLDTLITLHQVEILREHLLLQIKRVQEDISLKNTRHARNIDTVISNIRNMENMANTCFDCHHTKEMEDRLIELRDDVSAYKQLINRLFTLSADTERIEEEEDRAFQTGESLIDKVNTMISMASSKLESRTQASLSDISRTKTILYVLVTILPFLVGGLGYVFIRSFMKPVSELLAATRKLKSGDLDYRIEGLKYEFGEVAESFNEMSGEIHTFMKKIRESELRYADASRAAKLGHWERNLSTGEVYWSQETHHIFCTDKDSYNPSDQGFIDHIHPDDREMVNSAVHKLLDDNQIYDVEYRIICGDGSEKVVHSRGEYKQKENGEPEKLIGTVQDITERKRNEEALLRSHVMFTTVLDSIDSVIYVADMNTYEILYMNYYAKDAFGDLEGKICWQTLQEGQSMPCKFCSNDKLLTPEGEPHTRPYHWEFQNTANGRWYDIYDRAIEWIDGRIVRMEIARDITEHKQIEESLKRAEQMKLVGEWAAGLAHEIKNSLAGIKISVEVLGADSNISEEDRNTIFKAVDEIKRIELLLKSMLSFARPPKLQLSAVAINAVIERSIELSLKQPYLPSKAPAGICIEKDLAADLPRTMADAQQLQQVFVNILLNARDAMKDGGTLEVRTYYQAAKDTIKVDISDTGAGIQGIAVEKIFQPFVTTKSKGTGLGLAISKRIVEQHGGAITVENRHGGGVMFSINLPVRPVEKE